MDRKSRLAFNGCYALTTTRSPPARFAEYPPHPKPSGEAIQLKTILL
jgi:hypothetical protein